MNIDLKNDFETVYNYIVKRVSSFDILTNISPESDSNSVSLISLGYQYDQSGWVALVFDTREGARPDGEWTLFVEGNSLEMNHWFDLIDSVYENGEPITIKTINGVSVKIDEDSAEEEFECIGEMLEAVLIKARKDGVFENLPLSDLSVLSLEELNGFYGWPDYDDLDTVGNARNA